MSQYNIDISNENFLKYKSNMGLRFNLMSCQNDAIIRKPIVVFA